MGNGNYFIGKKTAASTAVKVFLLLFLVFSLLFFLWSLMRYNKIQEQKRENELYIEQLNDEIDELQYLVDMPLMLELTWNLIV